MKLINFPTFWNILKVFDVTKDLSRKCYKYFPTFVLQRIIKNIMLTLNTPRLGQTSLGTRFQSQKVITSRTKVISLMSERFSPTELDAKTVLVTWQLIACNSRGVIVFARHMTLSMFESFKRSKVNADIKLISETFWRTSLDTAGNFSGVITFSRQFDLVLVQKIKNVTWRSMSSSSKIWEHPCKGTTLCLQFLKSYCLKRQFDLQLVRKFIKVRQ